MMAAENPAVARAFGAAEDYERHAVTQRAVADALAARIARLPLAPSPRILEVGCGTGFLTRALRGRIDATGEWLLTDIAPAMLARCEAALGPLPGVRYAVMDGERPDLPPSSFDLVASTLTFQWLADLPAAITKLAALVRPGGYLAFATMAEESFVEWRDAHRAATGREAAMSDYPSTAALLAMAPPGFTVTIEEECIAERHRDAHAFLRALRRIGAHRPRTPRTPVSPHALRRAMAAFDSAGARITYHIAYLVLRRGDS